MAGVRIVTDSACDLRPDECQQLGIEVVPLSIRFGDEEYTDREELTAAEFYQKMAATDLLPETAAPSPGSFEERFRKLQADGADAIICINISRDLSATMEAAQQAARSIGDELDIRVIDSKSITAGQGTMVIRAAEAAAAGQSADEIEELVTTLIDRTRVYGVLDTLDNLKKGGRIGGAQALIGSVLSIKPLLDLSNGSVEEAGKQRTRGKALAWLRRQILDSSPVDDLAVMHSNAPDIDEFVASLREELGDQEIRVDFIGPVVGTHGGARLVGATWLVR